MALHKVIVWSSGLELGLVVVCVSWSLAQECVQFLVFSREVLDFLCLLLAWWGGWHVQCPFKASNTCSSLACSGTGTVHIQSLCPTWEGPAYRLGGGGQPLPFMHIYLGETCPGPGGMLKHHTSSHHCARLQLPLHSQHLYHVPGVNSAISWKCHLASVTEWGKKILNVLFLFRWWTRRTWITSVATWSVSCSSRRSVAKHWPASSRPSSRAITSARPTLIDSVWTCPWLRTHPTVWHRSRWPSCETAISATYPKHPESMYYVQPFAWVFCSYMTGFVG